MATSPNANDASDVAIVAPSNARTTSIIPLPIRGEKRIVPTPTDPNSITSMAERSAAKRGGKNRKFVKPNDFNLTAAKKTFTQYVIIRIPGRGVNGAPLTFEFLINPKSMQVTKQTIDAQALTRAGWQFGVWGEDMTQISMSGTTAGQYFSNGLTDDYSEFTVSYRNMMMLTTFFENNGYYFEGEQAGQGPLAADFTRRRVKMHQDVQLIVGNFIWYGMFDQFVVTQRADHPYANEFTLTFMAWKERYRSSSPYPNSIKNDIQRGHSTTAYQGYGASAAQAQQQLINQATTQIINSIENGTYGTAATTLPNPTTAAAAAKVAPAEPGPYTTDVQDQNAPANNDIKNPTESFFGGPVQGSGVAG